MNLNRTCSTLLAVLLISTVVFAAGPSDLADAAMHGDQSAIRTLLEQKANVNAAQTDGATALHWAVYRDDLATTELLIRAGANVKAANRIGVTPLYLASLNGSPAMIDRLLKAGADANEQGPNGETPLMLAARNGNPAAVQMLIDHGAEIDARDPLRQTTALMWALEQEHPAAVKVLVANGADLKAQSRTEGNNRRARVAETPAATAARNAAPAAPAAAAPPAGDDQDDEVPVRRQAVSGGLTPLVYAARQGDIESTKILLDAGVDVNQQSAYGWSALLTATNNRHYRLALYLIDRGADVNLANNGRLDASLPRHRQPQHRRRRLSHPQSRRRSSGLHQDASR